MIFAFDSFVVGVAKLGLRRQVVALEIEGSNPSAHPIHHASRIDLMVYGE